MTDLDELEEDRPFNLDELRVRTHQAAIAFPVQWIDYFTHVIMALQRLEAEIATRADLCAQNDALITRVRKLEALVERACEKGALGSLWASDIAAIRSEVSK